MSEEDINNIIEKNMNDISEERKKKTKGMLKRISRDKKSPSIIILIQ